MRNDAANKIKAKEWREKNREHLRAYMRVWREQNRQRLRDSQKAFRTARPGYHRNRTLRAKYGISQRDYLDMVIGQAGICLVCKKVPPEPLVIDHDHKTGKVRGLLCQRCNRMLGHVDESPRVLRSAIRYLEAGQ